MKVIIELDIDDIYAKRFSDSEFKDEFMYVLETPDIKVTNVKIERS